MTPLREYRVTLNYIYPHGTHLGSMQGHYVRAQSEDEAIAIVHRRLRIAAERRDACCQAQLWRELPDALQPQPEEQ